MSALLILSETLIHLNYIPKLERKAVVHMRLSSYHSRVLISFEAGSRIFGERALMQRTAVHVHVRLPVTFRMHL